MKLKATVNGRTLSISTDKETDTLYVAEVDKTIEDTEFSGSHDRASVFKYTDVDGKNIGGFIVGFSKLNKKFRSLLNDYIFKS